LTEQNSCPPVSEGGEPADGVTRRIVTQVRDAFGSNITSAPASSEHPRLVLITHYIIASSLIAYAVFAPHSIAATQGAFLIGAAAWLVQMATLRRFRQQRTPADVALFGFFACCVVSSFLSYDPLVSVKGLKSPAFFLAFYFVMSNVRSIRFAKLIAFGIVVSSLIGVGYSAAQRGIGRGVQVESIRHDSPLAGEALREGDIILEADDHPVNSVEDISRVIDSQRGRLRLKVQRGDAIVDLTTSRLAVKESEGRGADRLGIQATTGRNFRAMGFYSHYETYAEVLMLISALAAGLLITNPHKFSASSYLLAGAIVLLAVTLVMTATRAPIAGLAIAVALMSLANRSRRVMAVAMIATLILAAVGIFAIERSRGISVLDTDEGSTAWRLEVWREAMGLIKDNPLVGIGKGSEGKLKESLRLFDDGRLPPGHFHSTLVQVATWWGLPALVFYASFMTIFGMELWRLNKRLINRDPHRLRGLALGTMGALVAFNISSIFHFNFGDGEVVMTFWLLIGLGFAVRRIASETSDESRSSSTPGAPRAGNSNRSRHPGPEAAAESSVRAAKAIIR
jgi:O-antigen ligase/polysaccharide polymerase Wzy-like membrane protein/PDZ domain-containing protein